MSFLNTQVDDAVIKNWIKISKNIVIDYDKSVETMKQYSANCSATAYIIGTFNSGLNLLKAFLIAEHYGTYTLLSITIFSLLLNFLHLVFGELPNFYKIPEKLKEQEKYCTELQLFISDLSINYDLKRLNNSNISSYAEKYQKLIDTAPEIDDKNIVEKL